MEGRAGYLLAVLMLSATAHGTLVDLQDTEDASESVFKNHHLDDFIIPTVGESAGEDPPTTTAASGAVAAANQAIADAAAQSGNSSNGTQTESFTLPPAIMGGTNGEFVFEVQAVPTSSSESDIIGESADAQQPTFTEFSIDKAYTSLFDLKPLFMGIQADIHRRRALLGGTCIMSLKDIVQSGICKEGHLQADGKCTFYLVPPMTIAMQTLFNNARTNFCKFNANDCDATMCYTYGGPVAPQTGLQESSYHVMNDVPIWVHMGSTSTNGTSIAVDQVYTQMISFKISLEKVVFCEKIDPPAQTPDGHVRTLSCHTSRRCKMMSLEHGTCRDASADTEPAPEVACPTDVPFIEQVQAKEKDITSTLCSQL